MNFLSRAFLTCTALAMVQCKPRVFNGDSEVMHLKGTHNVACPDGTIEYAVPEGRVESGDYCGQKAQSKKGLTKVNPKAFNAYNIWRDGSGKEALDYPEGYSDESTRKASDSVFYSDGSELIIRQQKYPKEPTEGRMVYSEDGKYFLEYPVKNGKILKLKFELFENYGNHEEAVQFCKSKELRLPTIRELFDFCRRGYPAPDGTLTRWECTRSYFSATLDSRDPSLAAAGLMIEFVSGGGGVSMVRRKQTKSGDDWFFYRNNATICVGEI